MYCLHRPSRIPLKDFEEWFDQRVTGMTPEPLGESDIDNIVQLFPNIKDIQSKKEN